jgi:hypothetical protein
MKFKLNTTGAFYSDEAAQKLKPLGFQFEPREPNSWSEGTQYKKGPYDLDVEINSLEELMTFAETWGDLVISHDPPEIEIYDDYRE